MNQGSDMNDAMRMHETKRKTSGNLHMRDRKRSIFLILRPRRCGAPTYALKSDALLLKRQNTTSYTAKL